MKLLRRFLAPLLALCFALTSAPVGAIPPALTAAILSGVQGWSFPGSSIDLYFARNAGSCTVNRLLKPCASLLTTTRASTGYAQWADGHLSLFAANVPRITDLGLLVEQAATNLALQSQALATSPWLANRGTATNNSIAAPDGTTTGTLIQATSTALGAWDRISALTFTAQTYTLSGYLKAGTSSTVRLNIFDGADRFADFTLTGSGSTSNVGSGVTAVISQASNGWYRCSISLTTSATASGEIQFRFPGSTLTGTETFYVWGAQLETGSFPTSYIPTTTVAVTRATDVVRYPHNPLGAGNFTLFVSVGGVAVQTGKFPCLVSVNDGSGLNQTQIYSSAGGPTASGKEVTGGVSRFDTLILSSVSGGAGKIAMTLNGTAARGASNGGNVTALGTWTPTAAFTQMEIGTSDGSASNALNGYVKRLAIFQTGMTDAQMQAVTQ